MSVLGGHCHKIYAYENAQSYQPHSVVLCSTRGEEPREFSVYTDQAPIQDENTT